MIRNLTFKTVLQKKHQFLCISNVSSKEPETKKAKKGKKLSNISNYYAPVMKRTINSSTMANNTPKWMVIAIDLSKSLMSTHYYLNLMTKWTSTLVTLLINILFKGSIDTLLLHTVHTQKMSEFNTLGRHVVVEACQMKLLFKLFQTDSCCIFTWIKLLKITNICLLCFQLFKFLICNFICIHFISFVNHTHPPSLFCLFVTIHTRNTTSYHLGKISISNNRLNVVCFIKSSCLLLVLLFC